MRLEAFRRRLRTGRRRLQTGRWRSSSRAVHCASTGSTPPGGIPEATPRMNDGPAALSCGAAECRDRETRGAPPLLCSRKDARQPTPGIPGVPSVVSRSRVHSPVVPGGRLSRRRQRRTPPPSPAGRARSLRSLEAPLLVRARLGLGVGTPPLLPEQHHRDSSDPASPGVLAPRLSLHRADLRRAGVGASPFDARIAAVRGGKRRDVLHRWFHGGAHDASHGP